MGRRHEVSDEQWERLKSLLPPEKSGKQGRPAKSNRLMLNGILWVLRTGAPWRDLPTRFGPWRTVYSRFRRWTQRGVWTAVFEELSKDRDDETFIIDATIVRAHQDATGAQKKRDTGNRPFQRWPDDKDTRSSGRLGKSLPHPAH